MKNGDLPAAPTKHNSEHFQHSNVYTVGLTKRECFAMAALQGLLANSDIGQERIFYEDDGFLERIAIKRADILLAELEQ